MDNIMKRFTAHGTDGWRCGQRSQIAKIVQMVDTEPWIASKLILADQGATMSAHTIRCRLNEKGHYGSDATVNNIKRN